MGNKAFPKGTTLLARLPEGRAAVITGFELHEDTLLKLMEMGMAKGRTVRFIRTAPLGDPLEIEILRYRLAIRRSEAQGVKVRLQPKRRTQARSRRKKGGPHGRS